MPSNTYVLISSVTVGAGGSANVEFTSIPATYTDLLIKASMRGDRTGTGVDQLQLTFNGSTSGYSWRTLYGLGASGTGSGNASSQGSIPNLWENSAGSTSNTFSSMEIYIPNYASSNYKSISVDDVTEGNVTGGTAYDIFTGFVAGLWSNTAAITSIKLAEYVGTNILQYSTFYLYGIKNS